MNNATDTTNNIIKLIKNANGPLTEKMIKNIAKAIDSKTAKASEYATRFINL
jgi:hypothetical protein